MIAIEVGGRRALAQTAWTLGLLLLALAAAPASAEETEKERTATDPITLASGAAGKNYLNLSLDALVAAGGSSEPDIGSLQLGSHDPSRRGFSVQNVELVFSGAVDPYFTAQANVVFVESPDGGTEVEIEEVYGQTSSLPHNLQVRVGHFLTDFGRLNTQHPHSWDFVDQPLANARMFGGDGLRSSGVRLSWLMPTSFFSELMLTVQNAFGETLTSFGSTPGEERFGRVLVDGEVKSFDDMLLVPRWSVSFDPTANQAVLLGVSVAEGPNATADDGRTTIQGIDAFWKWKSPRAHAGFPFVKVQAEALRRRYRAGAPDELFEDHGAYAQASWGFTRGWVVGLRYDTMGGDAGTAVDDPFFEVRQRASANVTWFPTEYSKLRLQVNRDDRTSFEDATSVWLAAEFTLGAHAAHKF